MKGKGLTMERIAETAMRLVSEKGYNKFSMRELAKELHCQAASLYNHIESIDDINREVGRLASEKMNALLEEATEGKERDEALIELAYAYRDFVKDENELYSAIMGMPAIPKDDTLEVGRDSLRVVRKVVAQYGISRANAVNFSRCFRAALHGFASYEVAGYYTAPEVNARESFKFLVQGYLNWIHRMEEEQKALDAQTQKAEE